jgi:hypothetical protein
MSKPNHHQSINITGSQFSNAQLGQSLGNQNQSLNQNSGQSLISIDELMQSFSDLENLIKNSGFPEEKINRAIAYLTASEEESKASKPDKKFAANSLKKVVETLEEADKAMTTSQSILRKAQPILGKIFSWLGFASNFLI